MIIWLLFFAGLSKPLSSHAAPSARPGWGSIPYGPGGSGVTFRVWAPNASSVNVAGTFNSFSTNATPLFSEGTNGVWSVDVAEAATDQQYKYYIADRSPNRYALDPRCRKEVSSTGNSVIYNATNFNWAGDTFTNVPLNDAVVYELNIGSFNNLNPSDGVPGTFATATNRLAYLKQLGVSAIEVMPINEFPGNFSWGYNPSDLFGVESSFGGPDGFKSFVKACHQFGIGVLVDVVHNHYGIGDLDLWRFDGSFVSGGPTGGYGGIYFYQQTGLCCTPWGNTRPNYSTQQVRKFIQDTFTMWLDECHVDGFRWDSPYYMMNSDAGFNTDAQTLIQQCSTMIHTGYVGKLNIGESEGWLTGTAGFDSTWYASPFQNEVVSQLTASSDGARNMGSIDHAVNVNHNGGGASGWGNVFFMETHDSAGDLNGGQRLPVKIDGSNPTSYYARKRSTLGAALTMTTPGIPMILQGEEMLTTAQFGADDADALDWSRTNTYSGIVSLYTDLIRLRRNLDGRSSGLKGLNVSTIWRDDGNKLIAYRRWDSGSGGDDVIVICNFANTNWPSYNVPNFPKTGIWYTQLNSDSTKYSSDYGSYGSSSTTVSVNTATISIAPYSVLILSQNVPGAPPTPQNLKATPTGTNQIDLVWSLSSGATGYVVKRDDSQIATTSTTNYSDVGLAMGVPYCYTVAATNSGGVSADSAPACATIPTGSAETNLLAYWTFDEGSGATAYDSSGNANTGTVVSAAWTGGMVNAALYFDGTAQATVPNAVSLNPLNGITIAAWINSDGWFGNPRILEKGPDNQYRLLDQSGQLMFDVIGVTNVVTSLPSAGTWHHVAGTYDGASMALYVDGQLAAQQSAGGTIPVSTNTLAIGNLPGSGNPFNHFSGSIDDVRIYGRGLTANEVAQLYQIDSVGDGIANWWRQQYFGSGSTTGATSCASCDADGTGQNNLFKYVAGLDPVNPASVFMFNIASVLNQPTQQNLLFNPVVAGRTYTPQISTDLAGGIWLPLAGYAGPVTNGNQVTITDLNATQSNKFFRIDISLP